MDLNETLGFFPTLISTSYTNYLCILRLRWTLWVLAVEIHLSVYGLCQLHVSSSNSSRDSNLDSQAVISEPQFHVLLNDVEGSRYVCIRGGISGVEPAAPLQNGTISPPEITATNSLSVGSRYKIVKGFTNFNVQKLEFPIQSLLNWN
jgi:hypothetical protein